MNTKITVILNRFMKGALAGAITSMSMVTYANPTLWSDFNSIFSALGIPAVSGAITGLLLAAQKFASWKE